MYPVQIRVNGDPGSGARPWLGVLTQALIMMLLGCSKLKMAAWSHLLVSNTCKMKGRGLDTGKMIQDGEIFGDLTQVFSILYESWVDLFLFLQGSLDRINFKTLKKWLCGFL